MPLSRPVRLAILCVLAFASGTSSAATPEAGISLPGIEVANMDRSVRPGDDFFDYANGTWLKTHEIPADRAAWGAAGELGERLLTQTRALLEAAATSSAAPGTLERKVGDFYASAMDEAAAEKRGLAPLQPALARIAAVKSRTDLATYLGEELRADVDAMDCTNFQTSRLFGLWVAPDLNAPARSAPYLLQGGLGLPDREYYLSTAPKMVETRTRYRAHVEAVLSLARIKDAARRADRILALETKMARSPRHPPRVARGQERQQPLAPRRVDTTRAGARLEPVLRRRRPRHPAGRLRLAPEGHGRAGERSSPGSRSRAGRTGPRSTPSTGMQPCWGRPSRTRPSPSTDARSAGPPSRPRAGSGPRDWMNTVVGEAVGRLYVERHFSPEAKAQVSQMVKTITDAFVRRIDALDWMAASTKAEAKAKVASLYVGVGYPDHWTDFSGLEVSRDDLVGNVDRAERLQLRQQLAELGKPVDRTYWCMNPHIVNAVNLPMRNALSFPAGILQPPYFDPNAPASINYGAIGATIGHEISHSFDDQGALFDATGKVANWWTKEDLAHFEASGAQLAAQFDAYAPFPDLHVNGKQTLSENIADLAGLSASHDAWLASLGGRACARGRGVQRRAAVLPRLRAVLA